MSIEALAEYLGSPVTTIYDWPVAGKGPCVRDPRRSAIYTSLFMQTCPGLRADLLGVQGRFPRQHWCQVEQGQASARSCCSILSGDYFLGSRRSA